MCCKTKVQTKINKKIEQFLLLEFVVIIIQISNYYTPKQLFKTVSFGNKN